MIVDFADIETIRADSAERKLVMVGGTFDLFHPGHLSYLESAKRYGELLAVMLASNERAGYKARPDDPRPIIHHNGRATIVDSIKLVDYVFIVPGALPPGPDPVFRSIFKRLRPDYFVTTNADWKNHAHEWTQTKLIVLPRPGSGHSTTRIINHIRARAASPLD